MRERDQVWICAHPEIIEKYKGEYIAVVDEKIVAHGTVLAEVINQAKVYDPDPLISKVPSEEVLVV